MSVIRDDDKRKSLHNEYGMPVGRLMYHLYHEKGMSLGEIADEVDESRSTVQYWLQQSGVRMRSRTLSDVQRILIMAYIDAGYGDGSIAARVDCGKMTVNRYRKEMESSGEPVDLNGWISQSDTEILSRIIADGIANTPQQEEQSSSD